MINIGNAHYDLAYGASAADYAAPLIEGDDASAFDALLSNDLDGGEGGGGKGANDSTADRDNRLFGPQNNEISYMKATAEFYRLHKASRKQTSLAYLEMVSKLGKKYVLRPAFVVPFLFALTDASEHLPRDGAGTPDHSLSRRRGRLSSRPMINAYSRAWWVMATTTWTPTPGKKSSPRISTQRWWITRPCG